MTGWRSPRRPASNVKQSKAERQAEAESAVAAFLAKGGAVKQMPAVVATTIACASCGYTGVMGLAEGKTGRCPKCRVLLR